MIKISEFGFKESKEKPDLFYKNIDNKIILFFDFRVRLGEFYPYPHNRFYFKTNKELTQEEKSYYNKIILNEFFNVVTKIKEPVDFDELNECEICGSKYCISYGEMFCVCSKSCYEKAKKSFEEYRVEQIFEAFDEREHLKCKICGEAPELNFEDKFYCYVETPNRHSHHTDYNKNKTIPICPSCHAKITFHLDKYPELKKYKPIGNKKDMLKRLEEEKKRKREERLKKRKQKEIQKMTSRKGMGKYSFVPYEYWGGRNKSQMLGAWLK